MTTYYLKTKDVSANNHNLNDLKEIREYIEKNYKSLEVSIVKREYL